MAVIQDIIAALWQHDFAALADPHVRRYRLFRDVRNAVSGKWITASLVFTR